MDRKSSSPSQPADRNLMVGILAVQLGFISRDQLLTAMTSWIQEKQRPLEEILRDHNALSSETLPLLQAVVGKYLNRQAGEAPHSLPALHSAAEILEPILSLDDEDVQSAMWTVVSMADDRQPAPGEYATEIDRVCEQFIKAWSSESRPKIEEYLGRVPSRAQNNLLRELLQEEFHLRQIAGETPAATEYRERFPGQARIVERALAFHRRQAPSRDGASGFELQTDFAEAAGSPRFQNKRPHARGGLGEVYLAHDTELNREVALKEIRAQYARDLYCRSRFLVEAEITGRLEHPGVVPVYGLGRYADGRPYYAMRFIQGESLKKTITAFHQRHAGSGDLTTGEAGVEFRRLLGRLVVVCQTLEYAHSRGILHRDLKPGNIMLGPHGETLVVDWGLAKVMRRSASDPAVEETLTPGAGSGGAETAHGSALGTPMFMSPEQAAGRVDELGPATDIYSLGATLYQLLTGRPPFAGLSSPEILRRVQAGEFPRPGDVAGTNGGGTAEGASTTPPRRFVVPAALEAICLKAMSRDPAKRYASAAALATDIERYLADEPVQALVEPAAARFRRWWRKNPRLVGSVTAGLLVTTLSLGAVAAIVSRNNAELGAANLRIEGQSRQILDQNAQLQQAIAFTKQATAEAEEKRKLAETAQQAAERSEAAARASEWSALQRSAELASQRGDWQQTLEIIGRAKPLTTDPAQRIRLEIEKAKAEWVLSRVQESRQTLADLRAEVVGGELLPRIRLWSTVIDSRLGEQAETWLREIAAPGMVDVLEPGERLLVQALLTPKTGETVEYLRELLRQEPYFPGAQHLLILAHLFRGERDLMHREIDIARRLHSRDQNTAIAEALLLVVEKSKEEVEAQLPPLLEQMSEPVRPALKKLVMILAREFNTLRHPPPSGHFFTENFRYLRVITEVMAVGQAFQQENLLPGSTILVGQKWIGSALKPALEILAHPEITLNELLRFDCMEDVLLVRSNLRIQRGDLEGAEADLQRVATGGRLLMPLEAEVEGTRLLVQFELAMRQPVPLVSPDNLVTPRILPSLIAFYEAMAKRGTPFGQDLGFWLLRTSYLCQQLEQTQLGEKFLDLHDTRHAPTPLTLRLRGDLLRFAPDPELFRALTCYQRAIEVYQGPAAGREELEERIRATRDEIECRAVSLRSGETDVAAAP